MIREFETEDELDEEFEIIEEVNMKHCELQRNVDEAVEYVSQCQYDMEVAHEQLYAAKSDLVHEQETLENFIEENKGRLI